MAAEKKLASKVLGKVIGAGHRSKKPIMPMDIQEMAGIPGRSIAESGMMPELQKAITANLAISHLAGKDTGAGDGR